MKLKKNVKNELGPRGRTVLAIAILLLLWPLSAMAQRGQGWETSFSTSADVRAEGVYETPTNVIWILESFSPLELEPSETANFIATSRVDPRRKSLRPNEGRLKFRDSRQGLMPNPDSSEGEPFYRRADGSITALAWVDQEFGDVAVSGDINVDGGADGKGSFSRQGVMARWDKANNFYWFFVDFGAGEYAIWRTTYFGKQRTLPGSRGKVEGFDNTKRYHLEFELQGDELRGRVYDRNEPGSRGKLVGDTGTITDKDPHYRGVSGVLTELSLEAPYVPLEGSYTNVQSVSLSEDRPLKSQMNDLRAQVRENPSSFMAQRDLAHALRRSGQVAEAVEAYKRALQSAPRDVESLNNLAFIQATSSDSSLRDPEAAVANAELAFDTIMRAMNTRHTEAITTQYSKSYLLEVAYTQALAYAATKQFQDIEDPIGGSGDTDASIALATTQWALEVARNEHLKFNTKQTGDLLQRFEEAHKAFSQGQMPRGVSMP